MSVPGAGRPVNDWPAGFQAPCGFRTSGVVGGRTCRSGGKSGKAFCLVLSYADEALGLVILLPPAIQSSE